MNIVRPLVAGLFALSGCAFSGQMNGTRPTTAADRAAVAQAQLACFSPLGIVPNMAASKDSRIHPITMAQGTGGTILIDGEWVLDNHWQSPLGDHFFSWSGAMGSETIVAADRRSAIRFMYSDERRAASMDVTRSADGTSRPSGTPMNVETCMPLAEATQRLASGLSALPESGVREVSSEIPRGKYELKPGGCRKKDGKVVKSGILADWLWLPTGTFRDADNRTYVAFSTIRFGAAYLLYEVTPDPNGQFEFAIGAVTFQGKYRRVSDKEERMSVIGSIANREPQELGCNYFYPINLTNAEW